MKICSKLYMKNLLIVSLVFTGNIFCASFVTYRADYTRDGNVYEVAITTSNSNLLWSFQLQGQILSSPVVKNNIVYIGGRDTSLWAINGETGEIVWQYSTSGFVDSPPVVWKNYVYALSTDGKVYCFKLSYSGDEEFIPVWTYDTESQSCSSPLVIQDDKLIFVSGPLKNGLPQGYLYILNPLNGQLISRIYLGNFSYSSVSFDGENVYFTTNDGWVKAYSPGQERFLWSYKVQSCLNRATVVPYKDKLYFYAGDIERRVYVLDKYGNLVSSSARLSNFATDNTQVLVTDDSVYVNIYPTAVWTGIDNVVYSSQTLFCLSRDGLNINWRIDFKVSNKPENSYGFTCSPVKANNIIYFGTVDGKLCALDVISKEIIFTIETKSPIIASPAISNGIIYFATVGGQIYAIKADKFLSIVYPDIDEVIINSTTCKIVINGFINNEYEMFYVSENNEKIMLSSGIITTPLISQQLNTQPLLDGRYRLKFVLPQHNFIAQNRMYIDNSPLPPTNLTAVQVEYSKVLLTWTKSIDDGNGNNDVVYYNLYYSTDNYVFFLKEKMVAGTTFYVDQLQVSGVTYYYKLTAEDKHSQSIYSNVVKVYFPTIIKPLPPLNLTAEIYRQYISSAEVVISWNASVDESTNVVKYKLYRSTTISEFVLLTEQVKMNMQTYYFIDECVAGTTYFYIVKSENNYGVLSDSSNIASVFIPQIGKPKPPQNVVAYDTPEDLGGNITLLWTASPDENLPFAKVVIYRIYKSSNGVDYTHLYNYVWVGKSSYTFYDTSCPAGVTFYYYITAVNTFNIESEPSNITSAFSVVNIRTADVVPPNIPEYLSVRDYPNDDGSKLIIEWSLSKDDGDGENDVVKYKIYRNNHYLTYVPAGTTYYIDTNLQPGIVYFYYLTVVDKNGNESGGTQPVSCTPLADGIPGSIKNLIATVICKFDGISVLLSWDKSSDDGGGWNDVVKYVVYRSVNLNGNFVKIVSLTKGTTAYIDTSCEPQKKYVYKVVAEDGDGYSSIPVITEIFTEYKIEIPSGENVVVKYVVSGETLELVFSPLSIKQNIKLKIETDESLKIDNETIYPVSLIYKIETIPPQIKFNSPVKIKIFYSKEKIKNVDKEKLRLFTYDTRLSKWVMVNSSKLNLSEKCVEAEVYHFGHFVLGVYLYRHDKIFKEEHVYATPSPARGDEVKFKFIIYKPAKVKVYVYDINGDFIWQSEEKEYTEQHVGKVDEIKWGIKNVATGMYIFRVEGKSNGEKQNVVKKFAVIH